MLACLLMCTHVTHARAHRLRHTHTHTHTEIFSEGREIYYLWHFFTSRPYCPRGEFFSTHWIWGWVGPRACLDRLEKEKALMPVGIRATILRLFSPWHNYCIKWIIPATILWGCQLMVKLNPILIKRYALNTCGGVEV